MAKIERKYPGKSATEIFEKVDGLMERLAAKMHLHYQRDPASRTGKVHKMGVTGQYSAHEGGVTVDLHFPMLIPGSMKRQVTQTIEEKLDRLFA